MAELWSVMEFNPRQPRTSTAGCSRSPQLEATTIIVHFLNCPLVSEALIKF